MADASNRLPPPPFWRTTYFAFNVVERPDRRTIAVEDIRRAMAEPARTLRQPDGRVRFWY
jgi:hypothetical protein